MDGSFSFSVYRRIKFINAVKIFNLRLKKRKQIRKMPVKTKKAFAEESCGVGVISYSWLSPCHS